MAVVAKLGFVDMRTMKSAGSRGVEVQVYTAGLHYSKRDSDENREEGTNGGHRCNITQNSKNV